MTTLEEVHNKEIYNQMLKDYGEASFMGTFFIEKDNPTYVAFYIPTFEELCIKPNPIEPNTIFQNDNYQVVVLDIRSLVISEPYTLEDLIESDQLLNPQYEDIYLQYFIEKEDCELGVQKIIYESLNTIVQQSPLITKDDFLKILTAIEKKCLDYIQQEIGEEGDISITQLVNRYSISRPVFSNVLRKLEKNHIAVISTKGFRGTHIKFTHPEFI